MVKTGHRFIAAILIVLVLVSSMSAYAASASVGVGNATGKPGDTVSVNVSLSGNPGIAYLKLKIGYDASQLTLKSATNNSVLGGTFTTSKTTDVNPYVLQWMGAENSYGSGTIATISFLIQSGASAGDKAITVSVEECYNESFDDVVLSKSNGKISVNTASQKTLSSISVNQLPTKTTYNIGESLNTSGLKIKLTYSDATTEIISSGFSTSGFSSTTAGNKSVTVSYGGKTTSFTVSVVHTHSWGSGKVTKSASCTVAGERTYTCSCGQTKKETIPATGHSFSSDKEYCNNGCGTKNPNYRPPHTHSWGSGKVTKSASCTVAGERTYTCSCGQTKKETIPATGHSFSSDKEYCNNGCGTKNPNYTHQHSFHFSLRVHPGWYVGFDCYDCSCGESYYNNNVAPTKKLGGVKCSARTTQAQKITWQPNPNLCDGYQIQISNAGGTKWVKTVTIDFYDKSYYDTSYVFTGLKNATIYKFRVRYYYETLKDSRYSSFGKYYSPWSSTLTSGTLPKATKLTTLKSPQKSTITTSWSKVANITGYQVQVATSRDFKKGLKTFNFKSTSRNAKIGKLKSKTLYYVRIRTYKKMSGKNYCSNWSGTYKVKTK